MWKRISLRKQLTRENLFTFLATSSTDHRRKQLIDPTSFNY